MPSVHVLTLDLRDDPDLIADYERHHAAGAVWPEVVASIRDSGIAEMRIHRLGTLLVMTVVAADGFSFAAKAAADAANPVVQRWERLMERFQAAPAGDAKWREMREIFTLAAQPGGADVRA